MTIYKGNREKLKEFIERFILPALDKMDLDYYKVINTIHEELGISEKMIKEELKAYVNSGKLEEIRVFTVTKKKLNTLLSQLKQIEKETKKDIEKEIEDA